MRRKKEHEEESIAEDAPDIANLFMKGNEYHRKYDNSSPTNS